MVDFDLLFADSRAKSIANSQKFTMP